MSSKKWVLVFLVTVFVLAALLAGLNLATDPFGAFGDRLLHWFSYDETNNPRVAKLSYLEQHHGEYDSYILGCSSTSSFPVDAFNEAYGASFYNLIMYGADMRDCEKIARYLIEHYEVKNLILNVYLDNGLTYDEESDRLTKNLHYKEDPDTSALSYYTRYLFADPRYALAKLKALRTDTILPQTFDVFDASDGAYDKKVRDAEPIGNMDAYLESYPVFANYPALSNQTNEEAITGTLESLTRIKQLCEDNGVQLTVVTAPVYADYLASFPWEQVADFYTRLAEVTDYWDFSYSSVSFEPRYFYDETHFRECVGDMALARMFGDESVYIPEDFGAYVTADNVAEHVAQMAQAEPLPLEEYTAQVPVLMYHHISEEGNDSTELSPEAFEAQIAALAEAGYTSVFPEDLAAYVREGKELPEKPIVITFDDGYLSNYEYAYPILKKYGMVATIFVIGSTVGDTEHYKDTDYPITPHFSYEQAKEMVDSGVISIQSHTYDMHQWGPYEDSDQPRENLLPLEGESEEDYRAALSADCETIRWEIQEGTGEEDVHVIAFPGGYYDILSLVTLLENGFDISFSTEIGTNTLIKGLDQSLLALDRYNMNGSVSPEQMLEWIRF